MVLKKQLWALVGMALVVSASGCSAFTPENPAATLQAQRSAMIDEATSIAQAAQVQGTQVVATSVAAQTYVALMEGRNRQLIATMQVAFPPTQAVIQDLGPSTPGQMATPAPPGSFEEATPPPQDNSETSGGSIGNSSFTQVGTAASVRDSDGCADQLSTSFPADVQLIYITTRALNVIGGTQMRVEWFFEGQLAYSEGYTIPADDDDFCMWFSLVPTSGSLSSGSWSVTMFANDQAVAPPANFTVG
jgi:hypothetical protein